MLLNIVKLIILFIQTINQSICVDLNNITHADIQTLKREYPNIFNAKLQQHSYYIISKNEVLYCPVPYSHEVDNEEVPYEGIEIINRKLEEVVDNCVYEEKYALAYIIILNAIERMGLTYMYRFCEFAIEMNKKGTNIFDYLEGFSEHLAKLIRIFNREMISLKPYECILDVYIKHKPNHKNCKFNKVDKKYREDLLSCMELMKDKVHFLAEPRVESMNTMSIDKLVEYNNNNTRIILDGLRLVLYFPDYKIIIGVKNQTSCTICGREYSGIIQIIYIFSPCGHGWCCNTCADKIVACPVCNELTTGTQKLSIQTPTSIVEKEHWPLSPRCILDGREIRCLKCRSQIKDANPSNRHVMRPCGHGWYCRKCAKKKNCSLCIHKATGYLRVNLLNNE
ncbi:uncharacterized protein LOC126894369 [Daktulosphaira vitifoliae]|uniref:uncharacterized protein LOC126894369 n=1 Tax=Daktulosphaira vitifoliae TaxID=58002 RepID=UPI0021AA249F|nr:uncharacterized protein LOC126894369 [Daktulosphaira vitifoliae]